MQAKNIPVTYIVYPDEGTDSKNSQSDFLHRIREAVFRPASRRRL